MRKTQRCSACGSWHGVGEVAQYHVAKLPGLGFFYGYFCANGCGSGECHEAPPGPAPDHDWSCT